MYTTKNLREIVDKIPSYWVFKYYLNLSDDLTGQSIKIKSIFNPTERTPSMVIYVDKKERCYKYKDFSTGKHGNKIELILELYNLTYKSALIKIVRDYNKYKKNDSQDSNIKLIIPKRWDIDDIHLRKWNDNDAKFWLPYRIGKTMLENYNVKPIHYYTLLKDENKIIKKIKIENEYLYGYYNKYNELYKVYQPFSDLYKFYIVKSYIHGLDQLQYKQPYLIICSSLKDAMCLKSFGYNVEVIAPESENNIIKPYLINNLKQKYKKIITLFDNDKAGFESIEKYKKMYDIDGAALNMEKDISDSVKQHGFNKVHKELKPLLKNTLK